MQRPEIRFSSSGPSGNIFAILCEVRKAMQKQRRITEYNDMYTRVRNCYSYTEALAEIRRHVDLVDEDGVY